jgi:hypothetical protein
MQIIYAIFQGEEITAGFGKLGAKRLAGINFSNPLTEIPKLSPFYKSTNNLR